MTPVAASKTDLRRDALARRAALAPEIRAMFSRRLVAEGLALARRFDAASVSVFYPIRDEPDTLALLDALSARGFTTALPVTGARGEALVFRRWRPGEPTIPGQMRIPEPSADAPALDPDLVFTPLAVFDRRGHRIGYGAGHYDRTLAGLRARKRVAAVGVAYSVSEVEEIPVEPHDEPLDFILTEIELIEAKVG
jgi:5-formyltetrahydrofolate cyclo-ligase